MCFRNPFKKGECTHNWVREGPSTNAGGLQIWEGTPRDVCTKCGATRPHQECDHVWEPVPDNGKGPIINGKKSVRTAICPLCGVEKYETTE